MSTALRKDLPGAVAKVPSEVYRFTTDGGAPVTVRAPASKSVGFPAHVLARLIQDDRLGEMRDEMAAFGQAVAASRPASQARLAEFDRLAKAVTDPALRKGYQELAKAARGPARSSATSGELLSKAAEYDRWARGAVDGSTARLCSARARELRTEAAAP